MYSFREETVGASFQNRFFRAPVRQQSDEFCVISALKDIEDVLGTIRVVPRFFRPEEVTGIFFCFYG